MQGSQIGLWQFAQELTREHAKMLKTTTTQPDDDALRDAQKETLSTLRSREACEFAKEIGKEGDKPELVAMADKCLEILNDGGDPWIVYPVSMTKIYGVI
jgi:hypothetical protein